jgi:hypothetical protein
MYEDWAEIEKFMAIACLSSPRHVVGTRFCMPCNQQGQTTAMTFSSPGATHHDRSYHEHVVKMFTTRLITARLNILAFGIATRFEVLDWSRRQEPLEQRPHTAHSRSCVRHTQAPARRGFAHRQMERQEI